MGKNIDAGLAQQKIVMLTDIIENDKSKCAIYFPANVNGVQCFLGNDERRQKDHQLSQARLDAYFATHNGDWFDLVRTGEICTDVINEQSERTLPTFQFSFFAIKAVACIDKGGYTIRKFHCLYHTYEPVDSNETDSVGIQRMHAFNVYHYWFPQWPDHRSPENVDAVLDMCVHLLDENCDREFAEDDGSFMETSEAASVAHTIDTLDVQSSVSSLAPSAGPTLIIHW